MTTAITRKISQRFNECEITHIDREPIDIDLARLQHRAYEDALRSKGVEVITLPADDNLPDCVFVEDTAVVFDELAIITRPGAESRRNEIPPIEQELSKHRKIEHITTPGTVDGGDILVLKQTVFVGISTRSDLAAIDQMNRILTPYGYRVLGVTVNECLHLKSAITKVSEELLLMNPNWIDTGYFREWNFIEVDPDEPGAANALYLPNGVLYSSNFPKTAERLAKRNIPITLLDSSEVIKAEGALTCCSLLLKNS